MERARAGRSGIRLPGIARVAPLCCLLATLLLGCQPRPPAVLRPDVVLIVLDTVRRDYVEPCGSKLPTTPVLARFATGGTTFCNMVAPGSWTLPVHASLFTGLLPIEHGADFDAAGARVPGASFLKITALDDSAPTLAERFAGAEYETVLASANPVLSPATGLARGFARTWAVPRPEPEHRSDLVPQLERLLDTLDDPTRPLFLVGNVMSAHLPYARVPAGLD